MKNIYYITILALLSLVSCVNQRSSSNEVEEPNIAKFYPYNIADTIGNPYYEEAKLVIECEIMTSWHQNENDFRNATPKDWYADFDAGIHTVYIGEVIGAWRR